jgi:hypothetical protein
MGADTMAAIDALPESARRAMLTMQLRSLTREADDAEVSEREVDVDAATCELRERLDQLVEGRRLRHAALIDALRKESEGRIREARTLAAAILDRIPPEQAAEHSSASTDVHALLIPASKPSVVVAPTAAGIGHVNGHVARNGAHAPSARVTDQPFDWADSIETVGAANASALVDVDDADRAVIDARTTSELSHAPLTDELADDELTDGPLVDDLVSVADEVHVGAPDASARDDDLFVPVAADESTGTFDLDRESTAGNVTLVAAAPVARVTRSFVDDPDEGADTPESNQQVIPEVSATEANVVEQDLRDLNAASSPRGTDSRAIIRTLEDVAEHWSPRAEPSRQEPDGAEDGTQTDAQTLDATTLMAVVRELTRGGGQAHNPHVQSQSFLPTTMPSNFAPAAPFDANALAAAVAAAIAPLLGAHPHAVSSVASPVTAAPVRHPARPSRASSAKHLDVVLSSLALAIVLAVLAAWML